MGVMLEGQLEQAAGLLDQQVDLGTGEWAGESSEGAEGLRCEGSPSVTPSAPALDPWGPTSSSGTFRMGVPLISKMRSPTWMEFFTSGLMQPGSTLGINQWLDWFPSHRCPSVPIEN